MTLRLSEFFLGLVLVSPSHTSAGSVFVSGHDPDFHITQENQVGARNIIQRALVFARDGNSRPVLLLCSASEFSWDHRDPEVALNLSGYSPGSALGDHYLKISSLEFATTTLTNFSAIFVPSDYGGALLSEDIWALNSRAADLSNYLNAGGGLVTFGESGFRAPASTGPEPTNFGFLPFIISSTEGLGGIPGSHEDSVELTPFGLSLGLTNDDVRGNWYHCYFTGTGGMTIVDRDPAASNRTISLAYRGHFPPGSIAVEQTTWSVLKSLYRD